MQAYGSISKALQKIRSASTPDRFTQDFLATKLGMPGGGVKPVIPFLKRTGFLSSDGSPTTLYQRFRNPAASGAAAAEALRTGFAPLYEINEYAHAAGEEELKGIVVQATGLEEASSTVRAIVKSFRALQAFADFDAAAGEGADIGTGDVEGSGDGGGGAGDGGGGGGGGRAGRGGAGGGAGGDRSINLGYTINLQLPATSDIAVFNAIFKSLREHILRD